jgi:hypothetical protein
VSAELAGIYWSAPFAAFDLVRESWVRCGADLQIYFSMRGVFAMRGTWFKSSRSVANSACLEVRFDGRVLVRDSKDPSGDVLVFTEGAWSEFIEDVKSGRFCRP